MHDAFGRSGGAGSEHQDCHLVGGERANFSNSRRTETKGWDWTSQRPTRRARTHQFTRQTRFSIEAAWLDTLISSGIPKQLASDVLALTLSAVRGFSVRMLIENDPEQFARLMNVWRDIIHQHLAASIPGKPRKRDQKS
jgi:hypothetical protein